MTKKPARVYAGCSGRDNQPRITNPVLTVLVGVGYHGVEHAIVFKENDKARVDPAADRRVTDSVVFGYRAAELRFDAGHGHAPRRTLVSRLGVDLDPVKQQGISEPHPGQAQCQAQERYDFSFHAATPIHRRAEYSTGPTRNKQPGSRFQQSGSP